MVLKQTSKNRYPDHTETSADHRTEKLNCDPSIQPGVILSKSQRAVQSSDQANFL